jgi:hypothetical protein
MPRIPALAVVPRISARAVAPALVLVLVLAPFAFAAAARAAVPDDCRSSVDDPPPANGPANHRIGYAVSADGLVFNDSGAPALQRASVPDAVELGNGETRVYYVSGEAGRHGIHIARLAANGDIVPFECVRLDGVFDGHAVDPDVVRLADGRLRLFYKADFGLPQTPGAASIHSAVSDDGVHFTTEGAALEGAGGGADPTVTRAPDGTWLMATPGGGVVYLARSSDGQRFASVGGPLQVAGIPELWTTGNQVHLLVGSDHLAQLVSNDSGATWSQGSPLAVNLPSESGLGSPSVSGHAGAWKLFAIELSPPPGGGGGGLCQHTETALCLGGGRFRATLGWKSGPGSQGAGHARSLGRDSGWFWFFGPDNAEVLVKVLDGCAVNDAYWVFAAGLTTLEVDLRVEDLLAHEAWTYHARGGGNFESTSDSEAFRTCDAGGS